MKQKTIIALFAIMLLTAGSLLQATTSSGAEFGRDSGEPLQYVKVIITETNAGYYVINVSKPGNSILLTRLLCLGKCSKSFTVKSVAEKVALDKLLEKVSNEMKKVIVTANQNDDLINAPPLRFRQQWNHVYKIR